MKAAKSTAEERVIELEAIIRQQDELNDRLRQRFKDLALVHQNHLDAIANQEKDSGEEDCNASIGSVPLRKMTRKRRDHESGDSASSSGAETDSSSDSERGDQAHLAEVMIAIFRPRY